jgi:hypothetical protein
MTFNGYFSGPTYEPWTWNQVRFHAAALTLGILAVQALTVSQQSRFERQ